jgi:ribonuclease HII
LDNKSYHYFILNTSYRIQVSISIKGSILLQECKDILIGGVDEAGRGSIIGPLIVAGIAINDLKISELSKIGVKDSKKLTKKLRAKMFLRIINLADSLCIYKIEPCEVDANVFLNKLNKLEAEAMAIVINNLHVDNQQRYKEYVKCRLVSCNTKLYSMHHADQLNIVVSAASIIAKIVRDNEIQAIRRMHNSIGSGYPSDEKTMYFIRQWVKKYKNAPWFARKSWKPLRTILYENRQVKLTYFG